MLKPLKYGLVVKEWGWFTDAQESLIHVAKRSDKVSADMKGFRFDDTQESRFLAWKGSYMCYAGQQGDWFGDFQELLFQTEKRSNPQGGSIF
jgi:hypothetical protein